MDENDKADLFDLIYVKVHQTLASDSVVVIDDFSLELFEVLVPKVEAIAKLTAEQRSCDLQIALLQGAQRANDAEMEYYSKLTALQIELAQERYRSAQLELELEKLKPDQGVQRGGN